MRAASLSLVLFSIVGCAPGEGAIYITVNSDNLLRDIDHLHIVVTNEGTQSSPIDFVPAGGRPFEIPPSMSLQLRFSKDRSGPTTVAVDAFAVNGAVLAHGEGTTDLHPGIESPLSIELGSLAPLDAGSVSDGGATDASPFDMAFPALAWTPIPTEGNVSAALYAVAGLYNAPPFESGCIVGSAGTVLGALEAFKRWIPYSNGECLFSQPSTALRGLWGYIAVGDQGLILAPTNACVGNCGSMTPVTSGTTATLRSVWGSGTNDVYVVGDGATVLHSTDYKTWTPQNLGTFTDLYGVWGSGGTDVYAVGSQGTIIHSNGDGTWLGQTSGLQSQLNAIWGSAANDVYVVGDGGVILHSTDRGTTWTLLPNGSRLDLHGVWGDEHGEVFAVGSAGAILHSIDRGLHWFSEVSGTASDLHGVSGTWAHDVFVVGDNGTILHGQ